LTHSVEIYSVVCGKAMQLLVDTAVGFTDLCNSSVKPSTLRGNLKRHFPSSAYYAIQTNGTESQ